MCFSRSSLGAASICFLAVLMHFEVYYLDSSSSTTMAPVLPDREGEMVQPVPGLCWREGGCPCDAFAPFRSGASIGQRRL